MYTGKNIVASVTTTINWVAATLARLPQWAARASMGACRQCAQLPATVSATSNTDGAVQRRSSSRLPSPSSSLQCHVGSAPPRRPNPSLHAAGNRASLCISRRDTKASTQSSAAAIAARTARAGAPVPLGETASGALSTCDASAQRHCESSHVSVVQSSRSRLCEGARRSCPGCMPSRNASLRLSVGSRSPRSDPTIGEALIGTHCPPGPLLRLPSWRAVLASAAALTASAATIMAALLRPVKIGELLSTTTEVVYRGVLSSAIPSAEPAAASTSSVAKSRSSADRNWKGASCARHLSDGASLLLSSKGMLCRVCLRSERRVKTPRDTVALRGGLARPELPPSHARPSKREQTLTPAATSNSAASPTGKARADRPSATGAAHDGAPSGPIAQASYGSPRPEKLGLGAAGRLRIPAHRCNHGLACLSSRRQAAAAEGIDKLPSTSARSANTTRPVAS
mmetsp:Transcript_4471/g.18986  ORF Transcript_4471/g.18986 Transcript_4471/m.18986 type:complete len:456 (+) Transcript_4471:1314-2681(+)